MTRSAASLNRNAKTPAFTLGFPCAAQRRRPGFPPGLSGDAEAGQLGYGLSPNPLEASGRAGYAALSFLNIKKPPAAGAAAAMMPTHKETPGGRTHSRA